MSNIKTEFFEPYLIKESLRVQENCFKLWLKNLADRQRISKRINQCIGKSESEMLFQPNVSCCHAIAIAEMLKSLPKDAVPENIEKIALKEYKYVRPKNRRNGRRRVAHSGLRLVQLEVITKENNT